MSGLSKQFLFGDALDGIDTGGLNLAEFGLNNLIEQAQKDSDDENKSENNNRENSEDNNYDNLEIPSDEESDINLNENDLGIETLCEDNKGKIFKFSDLIIPMDEKDIQSSTLYNGGLNAMDVADNASMIIVAAAVSALAFTTLLVFKKRKQK